MAADAVWGRFSADPRGAATASMRASDADRDIALEVLRDAFADGRLTRDEYDSRTDSVFEVRALGDVVSVISDLVPVSRPPAPRRADVLHTRAVTKYRRDLRDARNGWIFVSGITVAIWAATSVAGSAVYFFWPIFPMIGVGIGWFQMRLNAESRIEDIEDKLAKKSRRRRDLED